MKYLIGFIVIAFGIFLVWRTDLVLRAFGRIDWAEQKLGGTRGFYKIAGVVMIILAAMIMTGDIVPILEFFF